jgi:hypothetical protein
MMIDYGKYSYVSVDRSFNTLMRLDTASTNIERRSFQNFKMLFHLVSSVPLERSLTTFSRKIDFAQIVMNSPWAWVKSLSASRNQNRHSHSTGEASLIFSCQTSNL